MVHAYVIRTDTSTPSDWSDVSSSYEGRFILGNGTALETGGTTQHTHGVSEFGCGSHSGSNNGVNTNNFSVASAHNHGRGTTTISTNDHIPPFKTFRLLKINVDGWNKKVPSGSVVFSESVPVNWGRLDNGNNYYIRISSTAGNTGGNSVHTHASSGTTGGPSATTNSGIDTATTFSTYDHTHSFGSFTTESKSNEFSYWSCGLVQASSNTVIRKNMILWFDGTPNSNDWTVITDSNSMYMRVSSTNSITTGGSDCSHNHSVSGSTGAASAMHVNCMQSYQAKYQAVDHTHSISITMDTQTPVLSYVRLILAKAAHEFSKPMSVYIITC